MKDCRRAAVAICFSAIVFAGGAAIFLSAGAARAGESRGLRVVRAPTGKAVAGDNWLLLIAIGRYAEWPPLSGPRTDAKALKEVLLSRYAFDAAHVVELYDNKATKAGIIGAFRELGRKAKPEDTLLVYYAGHGHTDRFTKTGYWVPHDAGLDEDAQERWLPNTAVRGALTSIPCAHVLLISDSCFSGDLLSTYRAKPPRIDDEYFRRAWSMRSRQVMTSGASEPVSDAGLGGHSAFAFHLLDTLKRNRDPYVDPLAVFEHVRRGVGGQMPLLGSMPGAGHQEGGSYIFFLREGGRTASTGTPDSSDAKVEALRRELEALKRRMQAGRREGEAPAEPAAQPATTYDIRYVPLGEVRREVEEEIAAGIPAAASPYEREMALRRHYEAVKDSRYMKCIILGGGVTMELVLIPAGEFTMGSPNSEASRSSDEGPQHRVRITRAFYMGKYEVTQAQYERIMGTDPSEFKGANNPVEQVSWNDATQFCGKLSQRVGRKVRLPTEAEWEYACRAGTMTPFHYGSSLSSSQANFDGGRPYGGAAKGVYRKKTTTVGSFAANSWGLYDMHGNVWEWCADWYDEGYYAKSPRDDPAGPVNEGGRVLRGGSWRNYGRRCRSALRYRHSPTYRLHHYGFRVAVVSAPGR